MSSRNLLKKSKKKQRRRAYTTDDIGGGSSRLRESSESTSRAKSTDDIKTTHEIIADIQRSKSLSSVDWDQLNANAATKILQLIASQKMSAKPDEMSRLMDIANPDRHLGTQVTAKRSDFDARIRAFDNAPPTGKALSTYVVPSYAEFAEITSKQREVERKTGIKLTEDQAWSMVLADKRGAVYRQEYRAAALRRLTDLNGKWKTNYTEQDFDRIMQHLVNGTRVTTNYTFSTTPGANTGSNVSSEMLVNLLMKDTEFRNMWEIGASQASTDRERRGAVEESMGYGHALKRKEGVPLQQTTPAKRDGSGAPIIKDGKVLYEPKGTFDPFDSSVMPKYAALVSQHQSDGVAARYGKSFINWKSNVRDRMTHTPGDSWNLMGQGALTSFVSSDHPEALFMYTDEELLRLAAAEATGKENKFLNELKAKGGIKTDSYIETQIHGPLRWQDVDEIVVGDDETNAENIRKDLIKFRDENGYSFRIRRKPASGSDSSGLLNRSEIARNIAAAAEVGDSVMFYDWSGPMGEMHSYSQQDWIDFLGGVVREEQQKIAEYIGKNVDKRLIEKWKANGMPTQLLPTD